MLCTVALLAFLFCFFYFYLFFFFSLSPSLFLLMLEFMLEIVGILILKPFIYTMQRKIEGVSYGLNRWSANRRTRVRIPLALLASLLDSYPLGKYEPAYPPS